MSRFKMSTFNYKIIILQIMRRFSLVTWDSKLSNKKLLELYNIVRR